MSLFVYETAYDMCGAYVEKAVPMAGPSSHSLRSIGIDCAFLVSAMERGREYRYAQEFFFLICVDGTFVLSDTAAARERVAYDLDGAMGYGVNVLGDTHFRGVIGVSMYVDHDEKYVAELEVRGKTSPN